MKLRILQICIFVLLTAQYLPAQSIGGATSGSTAYCLSSNSGFISLTGYTGNILHWQSSVNNGQTWIYVSNQTSTQSYLNLSQTTNFRAIVKQGSSLPDTSTISTITIFPAAYAGTISGGGTFCANSGNGVLLSNGVTGNILNWEMTTDGGQNWSVISNTNTSLPYSGITSQTGYKAVAENIPGCPIDTSAIAWINIDASTLIGNLLFTDSVCINTKNESVVLSSRTGSITDWYKSDDGVNWLSCAKTTDTLFLDPVVKTIYLRTTVKNGVCPTLTTTPAVINVFKINPAIAGEDKTITQYEPVTLNGQGNGTPEWNNENGFVSGEISPVVYPVKPTDYTLTITDSHGCKTYDSVFINVVIPVPNTISPNHDGVNDFFVVDKIENYPNNSLVLFNRWGQKINTFTPYKNEWNGVSSEGKELPNDIYYYSLDYGNGDKPLNGFILIKR